MFSVVCIYINYIYPISLPTPCQQHHVPDMNMMHAVCILIIVHILYKVVQQDLSSLRYAEIGKVFIILRHNEYYFDLFFCIWLKANILFFSVYIFFKASLRRYTDGWGCKSWTWTESYLLWNYSNKVWNSKLNKISNFFRTLFKFNALMYEVIEYNFVH